MIEQSGQLLFRILGPLEAWDGREWVQIRPPKWRALLAALLLHAGQQVPTDRLISEIWDESPPATANNLISVYVHHLRRLIGDEDGAVLVTRSPGYQVVLRSGELDADRFTRLVTQGREVLGARDPAAAAALLTQALDLWRGRALADVSATPLVSAEADRLEESRVAAVALRVEADLACGRHAQVIPELRRMLADDPLREELWELLMRALARAGRQAAALEAYDQARHVIAEELGVDPGAPLQQLYQQILNSDPAITAPPPTETPAEAPVGVPVSLAERVPPPAQLPADITDFTGRAGHVETLCRLLAPAPEQSGPGEGASPGAVRVVLVVGSGGLGKTTLAVHAAHLVAAEFPDGQLFAHLAGATHPVGPGEVLARFLRDLGVEPTRIPVGEEERAAAFRTRLAGKRVLIVLDDARDAAQVAPLLPGSASCAVLVTGRGHLPDIASVRTLDLDVLPPTEAAALFARIAGADRVAAEPQAATQVLTRCAGLPLALRIAGARLATRAGWSVATLAARLADERRRLDELRAGNLAVRACFEVSYASLPSAPAGGEDPARVFRLLGVWSGPPLSLAAAAALLGRPQESVADALEVLVDAHLLESPEPDRYRFHDLLRVFASDRARTQETPDACQQAAARLLNWYLHTTESAARIISPQHMRVPVGEAAAGVVPLTHTSLAQAIDWCETERPAIVAATRLAVTSGVLETAWKLPAAAMSFYYRRSHWADWVTTHEMGLEASRALGDRCAEVWMLNNLGMAYGERRQERTVRCFEQALAISRETGDARGESRSANNLANAYLEFRQYEQALEAAQQSLDIQRRGGFTYVEGVALGILGETCCLLGRFAEAVEHSREALVIFRSLGSRDAEADSLGDLGQALLGLGQVEEAIETLRESLDIRREIEDRHGQAATLCRLAQAQERAGDCAQARQMLIEALQVFEELGDDVQAAEVRFRLAEMDSEVGSPSLNNH
ncbi:MAG TPA: BTAD domain-containing putative transcriptional regulator [Streptosporangiaceae bacterium]|nr:BTAD domain-containing putative transcriptional regulator [Streptosporangiaceae bacterium]